MSHGMAMLEIWRSLTVLQWEQGSAAIQMMQGKDVWMISKGKFVQDVELKDRLN